MHQQETDAWGKIERDAVCQRVTAVDAWPYLVVIVFAGTPLSGVNEVLVHLQLMQSKKVLKLVPSWQKRLSPTSNLLLLGNPMLYI